MKNLAFLAIGMVLSLSILAQSKSEGVGIHYNLLMLENDLTREVQYVYEPGMATMFTKLYPPEMLLYQGAFVKHIETMRTVRNYVGPLGTATPNSLGDRGFQEAIIKINNGKLERVGRMFMEVAQYEDELTFKTDTVYLNESPLVSGSVLMLGVDSVYTENIKTGQMELKVIKNNHDFYEKCVGGSFIEEWHFDHRKGSLEKEIRYIGLQMAVMNSQDGSYRGLKPLFMFKHGKFSKKNINEQALIRENIEYNVLFNRDFSREDEDIHYYGMARASEAYGYIEPIERVQFLISILHNVKQGVLNVYEYDPLNFDIDNLKKVHPITWFDDAKFTDTVYVQNIETNVTDTVVVEDQYKIDDVVGIRFFEDWYMDATHMALYKRVKGIVILRESLDPETGIPRGVTPISGNYIKLNPKD